MWKARDFVQSESVVKDDVFILFKFSNTFENRLLILYSDLLCLLLLYFWVDLSITF